MKGNKNGIIKENKKRTQKYEYTYGYTLSKIHPKRFLWFSTTGSYTKKGKAPPKESQPTCFQYHPIFLPARPRASKYLYKKETLPQESPKKIEKLQIIQNLSRAQLVAPSSQPKMKPQNDQNGTSLRPK